MKRKGDQHIICNSAKKRMILQEREAQSCDVRCINHPHGTNCNSGQHVEVFLDEGRKRTKKNQNETICEGYSWLAECCLGT